MSKSIIIEDDKESIKALIMKAGVRGTQLFKNQLLLKLQKASPILTFLTEKLVDLLWTVEVQWDLKNTNFH